MVDRVHLSKVMLVDLFRAAKERKRAEQTAEDHKAILIDVLDTVAGSNVADVIQALRELDAMLAEAPPAVGLKTVLVPVRRE